MKSQSGFTLIELLVVMSISAMAVALIGGITVDSVSKFRKKAEQLELRSFLKQSSHQAFIHEKSLEIRTQGSMISLIDQHKQVSSITFEFLVFPDNQLTVNKSGFFSKLKFVYNSEEQRITLELSFL